ncbi:hypothetical protein [Henriciella sp.]|uniref:hypothetical protein n=1 Tax=Henriciella sp. TaxID=1968823 RepID=UPI002603A23B|nr:hypothetical protein [Henriciella sp.]
MQKAFILGLGLTVISALPAFADGYENAPPPNPGPEPLSPHEQETHYYDRDVYVERAPSTVTYTSSACCCCAPVTYGRTYVTEPVTVRRYTRTYTRIAPPDCYHTHSHGHGHHEYHHESYDRDVSYYSSEAYPVRQEQYSSYRSWHNDRAAAWAHYDRGWRN